MRPTLARRLRFAFALTAILAIAPAACRTEPHDQVTGIGDTPYLPAVYTEQQCLDLLAQFPGWAQVEKLPETDAQGRPTLWYAAIPITNRTQLDDLATLGSDVESMPIFTDDATEAQWQGQTGVMSKSTCGGAELHFALVPGVSFNAIKDATLQTGGTLVDAIVILPVPDVFADTSITYHAMHPASYQALHDAGFAYMGVNAPPPAQKQQLGRSQQASSGFIKNLVTRAAAVVTDAVPNLIERGIGWIDRQIQGSVKLTIHLDLRNTDSYFGGELGAVAGGKDDKTTPMLRAWGAHAGQQIQLPGVAVAAQQIALSIDGHGIRTRFQGDTDANGTVVLDVTQGKGTGICLEIENQAASINDFLTRMELCDFERTIRTADQAPPKYSFDQDTSLTVRLQNKYLNMLAQFTDGRDYLEAVAGYTPRHMKVLTGPPTSLLLPFMHGRAVTPCLDFPNIGLDVLDGFLSTVASIPLGPLGWAAIQVLEAVLEVDMWMPDRDVFTTNRVLEDRTVPSHEYGHFVMCSLLFDADPFTVAKMSSLLLQRISEGSYMNVDDEATTVMEGWADFFAGQTSNGYNYFLFRVGNETQVENPTDRNAAYCKGAGVDCWELNYVEDKDSTRQGNQDQGFTDQVRRVSTILFDAFDGHAPGKDEPGQGDFWEKSGQTSLVRSLTHQSDAHDEPVALPGSALQALFHEWTHGALAPFWQVDHHQFFAALNATIRTTLKDPRVPGIRYSWCDACQLFSQHEAAACALTGAPIVEGICRDIDGKPISVSLTPAQMVTICRQNPVHGFVGDPPPLTDPTSACTFTGCPPHSVLVGQTGDPGARCVSCGTHQVSSGAACLECGPDEFVGGPDGNRCTACTGATPHRLGNTCVAQCDCGSTSRTCYIDQTGTCVQSACAAGQVNDGGRCLTCPPGTISVDGSECQVCLASQGKYQAENQCLTCPPGQIPNASNAATACAPCGFRQISIEGACQTCPPNQIAAPNNTCQPCPAGQLPLDNRCIPLDECQPINGCRTVDPSGLFCRYDFC